MDRSEAMFSLDKTCFHLVTHIDFEASYFCQIKGKNLFDSFEVLQNYFMPKLAWDMSPCGQNF